MSLFLRGFFDRTKPGDMMTLLSDIEIEPDGMTHDPAAWDAWLDCVERALAEEDPDTVTS
jgi:hypothetical protein